MNNFVISAETILPISSKPSFKKAIVIENGTIIDIGSENILKKKYSNYKYLNLGNGILLPGFINGHVHLELGWIQPKIGNFDNFIEWLQQIIKEKSKKIDKKEISNSVKNGISALVKSGVTTVGEISSFDGIDIPILKKSGLRTVLFKELVDSKFKTSESVSFEKDGLYEERPFPHAPYSCKPELLENTFYKASRDKIPVGIHLGESKEESKFIMNKKNDFEKRIFPLIGKKNFKRNKAVSSFDYISMFKNINDVKITGIHMVQVKKEEIKKIKKMEFGIILCPRSNLFLKVGVPPLIEISKLDRVGLGTDGLSSNYNLNFFEEIRTLHLLYSNFMGAEAAYSAVYAATLGGAKALFIENKVGSIEKGKKADLIFLKTPVKKNDPYLSVISSSSKDLELSMVDGKVIYSKNKFLN